jgi:alkylhydroperoxidase family enzyme
MLWLQNRRFGRPLGPVSVWAHSPVLLRHFLKFQRGLERRKSPLPAALRALITVQVSRIHHCAFCQDYNSYRLLQREKGATVKLSALDDVENSAYFSDAEKAALAYAAAVCHPDRKVEDTLFARLRDCFNDQQIVELTALIGVQSLSASFNAALDIPAQGICELPPEAQDADSGSSSAASSA